MYLLHKVCYLRSRKYLNVGYILVPAKVRNQIPDLIFIERPRGMKKKVISYLVPLLVVHSINDFRWVSILFKIVISIAIIKKVCEVNVIE